MRLFLKRAITKDSLTYTGLWLFIAIGIIIGTQIAFSHSQIRIVEGVTLLILLLGFPFVYLQAAAGLPTFWQRNISWRTRFLIPIAIGLAFGTMDVVVFKWILHPVPYQEMPPFTQPFPYSIFLYVSGAFEVEVFYRMIPLTLLLLLGTYFRGGLYYDRIFWIAAVLTALREPLEQLSGGDVWIVVYSLLTGFGMNLLQAVYYRKAGFLASLSLRLGHYLIWHILLGAYIQYLEIGLK